MSIRWQTGRLNLTNKASWGKLAFHEVSESMNVGAVALKRSS